MSQIINTRAPALPIAGNEYTRSYQDRYSNILRLYFNQLDTINAAVLGDLGMRYLDAPHISASDSTNQYATANDTPKLVAWDTAVSVRGFTLNPSGTATATAPGVYKIDYSLQFANNANAVHDVFVWLQTNGTQVPDSSSRFTLQARKSASVPSYIVAYSSIVFEIDVDDEIGLWWATDQARIVGTQDGVFMEAIPASTTPYARPANPSAVGSITFLGRL
jgi:hypothetical protein